MYSQATSPLPHQPVRTVRTAQSASFFFPVWWFKQIMISLAPDICLNPNDLCWVHDDEGYALVRFEAIPRMLIFGLKFDPWSRFWSHLPTERILDPQKLMIICLSFNTLLLSSSINWFYLKSLFDNHLDTLTCLALQLAMSLNHCFLAAADPLLSLCLEEYQRSH